MSAALAPRNLRLDVLKLVCAQCIVLHHFSAYGPLSDALLQTSPMASALLFDYGRMAVQVFLVLGGYLAAVSLSQLDSTRPQALLTRVWQRYRRLIVPLLAALLLVSVCAALVRPWLHDDFIPTAPTWAQLAAHVLLLQDVLDMPALSLGVWYVAIDFQLYALLATLTWFGLHLPAPLRSTQVLVMGLMLVSLFYANLQPDWDVGALYFFGAYGMGVVAFWAQRSVHRNRLLLGMTTMVALALWVAFRERLVLALLSMLVVAMRPSAGLKLPAALQTWIARLGAASYGQFLTHFVVVIGLNAVLLPWLNLSLSGVVWWLLTGVLLSIGLGLAFTRLVERPVAADIIR